MKTALKSLPPATAGYALMLTMMFLGITLLGFGSIMAWVSSSSSITNRNNLHVASQAGAESATENVITSMMRDFTYGSLQAASIYQAMVPSTNGWPVVFTFQSTNGIANQTSVSIGAAAWKELPSQFNGLSGYGQDCIIASTATTAGQRYAVPSTVTQAVWFGNIPLFQFAIFYNQDMEINPGGSMAINGRVHSNYNIWATGNSSTAPLTFNAGVDASGIATNRSSTLDPRSPIRTGNAVYSNTNNPVSNADSLTLPVGVDSDNNPTNVESILRLPPAGVDPSSTNGQVYLYNTSNLVISNSPNGINGNSSTNVLTVYYQNPNAVNRLTPVVPDVSISQTMTTSNYVVSFGVATNHIPTTTYTTNITSQVSGHGKNQKTTYTTNIIATAGTPITQVVTNSFTNLVASTVTFTNYYYSFVTNQTFYDYREGKTVQAVQVDVGLLNTWLTNSSTTGGAQYDTTTKNDGDGIHGISSIYAYSDVGLDGSTLPAVRVTDGAQLPPSGLTVSTQLPLYVEGNYNITDGSGNYSTTTNNTTYTRPAALLGDALTILSANWSDAYNSGTSAGSRSVSAANTTINAATMEGIVPSDGTYYSGGVENFMRLLEQWGGHTLTYNGSIVVMFASQYATTPWEKNGAYYSVPTRNWAFDNNFTDASKLPPLTPQLKATVRGSYITK